MNNDISDVSFKPKKESTIFKAVPAVMLFSLTPAYLTLVPFGVCSFVCAMYVIWYVKRRNETMRKFKVPSISHTPNIHWKKGDKLTLVCEGTFKTEDLVLDGEESERWYYAGLFDDGTFGIRKKKWLRSDIIHKISISAMDLFDNQTLKSRQKRDRNRRLNCELKESQTMKWVKETRRELSS